MKELNYLDITKTGQGHIKVPSATGIHPDMGVGTAQQIQTNIHETNSVPYVFRPTPYNATREKNTYVGVSVAWNQLASPKVSPISVAGMQITFNSTTGVYEMSGSANATYGSPWDSLWVYTGHNYLLCSEIVANPNNVPAFNVSYLNANMTAALGTTVVKQPNGTKSTNLGISGLTNGTNYTGVKFRFYTVDLTVALTPTIADYIYTLESGTAGAGIAKLREWGFFDKPYYAYNAGAIESVNVSKHRMVGLNAFDEVWEDGYYDGSDGSAQASTVWERNKNAVKCLPNTDYYLKQFGGTGFGNIVFYDGAGNFVSSVSGGSVASGYAFTTPTNVYQIKFYRGKTNNSGKPVCLNLSNPAVNGTYEPYTVHEYPLPTGDLRGVLKLDANNNLYAYGDIRHPDKPTDRLFGIVDLGTLDWRKQTEKGTYFGVRAVDFPVAYSTDANTMPNIVCAKYATDTPYNAYDSQVDKTISVYTNGSLICRDSAYSSNTADEFKTAMSGVYLVYPLATPTTETTDPYTNPQVCSPYGTEEFVDRAVAAGTRDVAIPCGHETEYPKNIVGAIEGIPLPPSTNGNFKLRCTVASGVPTYSWVSE